MLIGLMQGVGILYYWTWPIWPFIFVFSFAFGLAEIIRDEQASGKNILIACISLLVILAGMAYPHLS